MADTAALFSSFFLVSAAAFLFSRGVTLPWPSKTRPTPATKSALLAELASAEARLRSTAPAVRAFGGRVAAAEAAGREPADRDALKFSLEQLELSDAAHWGAGSGAGLRSSAEAGAALAALRADASVAAAAAAVLRAHPLFVPRSRVMEALLALNGEELALTRAAIGEARRLGVPVHASEFERIQQAVLRQRLKDVGAAGRDAGSGALLAGLCPDLKHVAPVWTSAVQLALLAERAGVAGYEGMERDVAAVTNSFRGAWEAGVGGVGVWRARAARGPQRKACASAACRASRPNKQHAPTHTHTRTRAEDYTRVMQAAAAAEEE
jgi:hypothetical protein